MLGRDEAHVIRSGLTFPYCFVPIRNPETRNPLLSAENGNHKSNYQIHNRISSDNKNYFKELQSTHKTLRQAVMGFCSRDRNNWVTLRMLVRDIIKHMQLLRHPIWLQSSIINSKLPYWALSSNAGISPLTDVARCAAIVHRSLHTEIQTWNDVLQTLTYFLEEVTLQSIATPHLTLNPSPSTILKHHYN